MVILFCLAVITAALALASTVLAVVLYRRLRAERLAGDALTQHTAECARILTEHTAKLGDSLREHALVLSNMVNR